MHGVDNEAGPFSERYVFPDGEPLHLSRIQLALERAGLFTDQVEGFEHDYAKTVTEWIANFESRLGDAERIAGVERTRVWRVYLHAARVGFETGFEAVYQVRARRPE
jgi:cyclopropane-fatty-acyl-phospholipid synthase